MPSNQRPERPPLKPWTQSEKLEDIYRSCAELAVRQNRLKDHLWLGFTLTMVLSLVLLLVAADPWHRLWPYQVCRNETTYETSGLFWRDDIGACPGHGEPFMTRDREWVCRAARVTPVCHTVYPTTVWEDGVVNLTIRTAPRVNGTVQPQRPGPLDAWTTVLEAQDERGEYKMEMNNSGCVHITAPGYGEMSC